ncbi:hypothetical protein J4228_03595 [Candidatus Woesearchaeota archaeon]|nr:hypothetical protein [Candidatus Woesearchaeota archaeon]
MATAKVAWKFPQEKIFFMRLETATIAVLAVILFAVSLRPWGFLAAVFLTAVFLVMYVGISYVMQIIRLAQEEYVADRTHLKVTRKTRFKTKKEEVPLKEVLFHKLDRFFLGGYLISKKGKHLLFFSTKKELDNFDKHLKKHSKSKKKK